MQRFGEELETVAALGKSLGKSFSYHCAAYLAGEENQAAAGAKFLYLEGYLEPVEAGHHHVTDQYVGAKMGCLRHCVPPGIGAKCLISTRLEDIAHGFRDGLLIIDNEYF